MRGRATSLVVMAVVASGVGVVAMARPRASTLAQVPGAPVKGEEPKATALPSAAPEVGATALPAGADLARDQPPDDDPMQAVEAFLARNRQEAAGAVAALTQEADALRARLQKVEMALGRWKAIAGALEAGEAPPAEAQPAANEPQLLPVPPPQPMQP